MMVRNLLRVLSLIFLLSAVGLLILSANRYAQKSAEIPEGTWIADIPVGGLSADGANARVEAVYLAPVDILCGNQTIRSRPEQLGFTVDKEVMLAQVGANRSLSDYWRFLWNLKEPEPQVIPLGFNLNSGTMVEFFKNQIIPRCETPARGAYFSPEADRFIPGEAGMILERESFEERLKEALLSPDKRSISLDLVSQSPAQPDIADLEQLLRSEFIRSGFPGVAEVYLSDLDGGREISFALNAGQPVEPGIAFTAASTMKIPVMVSVLRRAAEPTPADLNALFNRMIVFSENPPTDTLMAWIDPVRGPLEVTEDMRSLGLSQTFIAGFFYLGAPLLEQITTEANSRSDVDLNPDIYNQTTPPEIGKLLEAVYNCSRSEDGLFREVLSDEISASECELILSLMRQNKNGLLIEAGIPDGIPLAHKHGWIEEADGLLHTMSDVGLVTSPGGDFVLVVYLYDYDQLQFNAANHLTARIANRVYNFFNMESPADWNFGNPSYP